MIGFGILFRAERPWLSFVRKRRASKMPSNIQEEFMVHDRCILVNELDQVIGYDTKKHCHSLVNSTVPLHRAFSLFLFSKTSFDPTALQLLIQRRSCFKLTYPGLWSNTCCSHPLANIPNETLSENATGVKFAARRKLKHELGIDVDRVLPVSNIYYLGRIIYLAHNIGGNPSYAEHEVDYILVGKLDSSDDCLNSELISLNPEEVSDAQWIEKAELAKYLQIDSQHPLPDRGSMSDGSSERTFTPWFRRLFTSGYLSEIWTRAEELHGMPIASEISVPKLNEVDIIQLPP